MTADVLVIGGGIAGLLAAREALRLGARVTQIADGGGSSPFIHGVCVPMLPEDSVECFRRDTIRSGYGAGDPELVAMLCRGSKAVLPLLEELGIDINRANGGPELLRPLGATYPRVISAGNSLGAAVIGRVREELTRMEGYRFLEHTRALKLLQDDGAVCGASCFQKQERRWRNLRAGAVVLACGGYCGIYPFSTNGPDSGGDGVAMASMAGAKLRDMEYVQFEPSAAVYPPVLRGKSVITTMLYEGAVLRNRRGQRFMDERVNKDVLSRRIYEEIRRGNGTEHGGVYLDATGLDPMLWRQRYRAYYRRYCNAGIDISQEFMEIAPAAHTASGGVTIDPACCTTVPGLFACGEAAGGIHGANRMGGNAGLETLVFGPVAGRSAAEYAMEHAAACRKGQENSAFAEVPWDRAEEFRLRLNRIVDASLNVVRNPRGLARAKGELEALCRELSPDKLEYQRQRLYNDALCAQRIAEAALANHASLGAHILEETEEEHGELRKN